jgi:tetratricopeptide (TPR) repeat protein
MGGVMQFLEGMERKQEIQRQALALASSLGDRWNQAMALSFLAWDQRDPEYSRACWEEAIAVFRQVGDWRNLAFNLGIFGYTVLSNGEMDAAQVLLDECLEINRRMNYKREMEFVLTAQGQLALLRGEYEQAREFLHEWAVLAEEMGNRMGYLWARARLGYVALCEGNLSEAEHTLAEIMEDFHKDRNKSGLAFVVDKFVSLYVTTNKPEVAARLIGWSDATREEIGDPRPRLEQADLDRDIARIRVKIGNTAWEETYFAGRAMVLDEAVALALREK